MILLETVTRCVSTNCKWQMFSTAYSQLCKMSLQIHFPIILPSRYYLVSRFHDMGSAYYRKMFCQPSVSNDNMDNICQSVMPFEKVTKKLSHQNKDFNTSSMSCICLRSLIWYNLSTADGLYISLEYTCVLYNGVFTDKVWFHLTYVLDGVSK